MNDLDYNGTIDEVRIYNHALSSQEIWLHYQSEFQKYGSSEYRFYANITNLSLGTYTYYAWANDTVGTSGPLPDVEDPLFVSLVFHIGEQRVGHLLGIIGLIMMLMTEILYSLRKRSRLAHWGRMSDWLGFHIFTGLVGPYMVLLHTSWKFNGLAGVITLFTIVIVFSGFIGRYIYTLIPRTTDGVEIISGLSTEAVKQARRLMALWHTIHIPLGIVLFVAAFVHIGGAIYYALLLR